MSNNEEEERSERERDEDREPLVEEQEHKGYGADPGERERALDEADES